MATNLRKEKRFFAVSNYYENKAIISTVGKQSIKISLPCSCNQTQHFYCGKPRVSEEHAAYKELMTQRFQWFEFCEKHKVN